ncbi:hypothetical protein [Chitinophaga barathri]|uniref:GH26 domain-containing protein n=1 Tax=Chitinophaga barathri TaxID=1647451 RepID=A0A3N4MM94_9BACT|nr:hypothetical protein [Chitinophaga barathri]RPD40729.1 hypothetical protein EG028_11895 [Chitinophaga barathri]
MKRFLSVQFITPVLLLWCVSARYNDPAANTTSPGTAPGNENSFYHKGPLPAKPAFKWAGAWQPTRKSSGDGITQLDIKIGSFITLPDKESLAHVIFNVQNRFPGAKPWATWAVGDLSRATPSYAGISDEAHEQYLDYMDQLGVTVFLEIFPFKANPKKGTGATDVTGEIDRWLGKFKHHPCVGGMGIELEYFGKAGDSAARVWDERIKSHKAAYRMFLRHYSPDHMPPAYRGKGDIIFINDASEGTLEELNKGFAAWANRFAPSACAFQLGYPADEDCMDGSNATGWWKLKDPVKDWGNALLPLISNPNQELGYIWVTAKSGKTYNTAWDLTKGSSLPVAKSN